MLQRVLFLLTTMTAHLLSYSQSNTFPSTGNVGIGTLTPQQRLHVEGSSNQAIFVSTSPADAFSGSGMIGYLKALPTSSGQRLGYLLFGSRGGAQNGFNTTGVAGFAGGAWSATSRPSYLIFETTPSGSVTRVERMRIDQNGNMGIGTKNPQYRLHVEGANNQGIFVNTSALSATAGSGVTGAVKQLPTAAGQRLGFFLVGSRGGAENQFNSAGMTGFAAAAWSAASRPTYLVFETALIGSTTRTEQMRINEYGGVCIGTTLSNDNAKLNLDAGSKNVGIYVKTAGSYGIVSDGGSEGVRTTGSYSGVTAQGGTYGILAYGDYGVYGYGGHYGVYGYNYVAGGYAGYFNGNVYTTGAYLPSDQKLKQNIEELSSAMALIAQLKPKSYEYLQDGNFRRMNLPTGKQYGFIAQDLEAVLPNLVKESHFNAADTKPQPSSALAHSQSTAESTAPSPVSSPNGAKEEKMDFKAINYTALIPIIVKGIQEQQQQISDLRIENEELKARLQRLEALLTAGSNNASINVSSAYLEQASPNPARSTTIIRYGIPDGASSARLTLINAKGQTLKEISLSGRRQGQVNLSTQSLPSGVYTYTLWVNGSQADSKQLVVAR